MNKPNWNFQQLNANYRRYIDLVHQTDDHDTDCQCNLCMECFGFGENLGKFSEDEHATAVIREREIVDNCGFRGGETCEKCGYPRKWHGLKGVEPEKVEPVLENEFQRHESRPLAADFEDIVYHGF